MNVVNQKITKNYAAYNGDTCEVLPNIEAESIGFSVFSPPFASLYTYSNSERDLGNSKTDDQFFLHFGFIVSELFRVMQKGRIVAVHCMNLPTSKERDGYIGIRDFRGDIIRLFQKYGFIYHSEVCIWKDPVTAMQRTKALGLLHKQITKDSCMSRQGLPDYVCAFRKPGDNGNPVDGEFVEFVGDVGSFRNTKNLSIDIWQKYASPVWMDIRQSRTLNKEGSKEQNDERHICPLQLDVIERCLQLWSKEGDVVLSPFMGIGSEGYCSILRNRKFIGIELKESYFQVALKNLEMAVDEKSQDMLFEVE